MRGFGDVDGMSVKYEVSQLHMTSKMSVRATLDFLARSVIIHGGPRLNTPC